MPLDQGTPVRSIVVPYESDAPPDRLGRLGHREVAERWRAVDRSAHAPTSWPSPRTTATDGPLPRS